VTFTSEETIEITLLSLRELLPSAKRMSDKQLVAKIGEAKLSDASDQIYDFIMNGCSKTQGMVSKNEYSALTVQSLKCLSTYLQLTGAPTTANTLVNSIHFLPLAVDRAFPMYAASGLLRKVVRPQLSS